jgi:hypothetical protein
MKERLRVYMCQHCRLWHMTKVTVDTRATRKRGYTKKPDKPKRHDKTPKTRRPKADLKKVEEALAKKEEAKKR